MNTSDIQPAGQPAEQTAEQQRRAAEQQTAEQLEQPDPAQHTGTDAPAEHLEQTEQVTETVATAGTGDAPAEQVTQQQRTETGQVTRRSGE